MVILLSSVDFTKWVYSVHCTPRLCTITAVRGFSVKFSIHAMHWIRFDNVFCNACNVKFNRQTSDRRDYSPAPVVMFLIMFKVQIVVQRMHNQNTLTLVTISSVLFPVYDTQNLFLKCKMFACYLVFVLNLCIISFYAHSSTLVAL